MNQLPPSPDWSAEVDLVARQPELFSKEMIPAWLVADAPVLRSARGFRFSGKISTKDEGRCLLIAMLVKSGRLSHRKISEMVQCDRRTVIAVMRHLEDSGELPAIETRVKRLLLETEEQVLIWIDELIESRVVDRDHAATLRSLFTGAGIAADKRHASSDPLSAGGITVQVGVNIAAGSQAQADWQRRLAAVIDVQPDSESGAESQKCQQIECAGPANTELDTRTASTIELEVGPAATGPSPEPIAADPGRTPGGGVAAAAPAPRGDA